MRVSFDLLGISSPGGPQFVVVGERDVVILKNIAPPSLDEFDALIADARKKGKQAGLKRSDIAAKFPTIDILPIIEHDFSFRH